MDWEELYPNFLLQSMATNDSDHYPLHLGLKDNHSGVRHFHFEVFWPQLQGFYEVVTLVWNSVPAVTCPFYTLDAKIKAIIKGPQSWSDKNVGHVSSKIALAREILHRLKIANDRCALSPGELCDEDINTSDTIIPSIEILDSITRSRAQQLR
jgi:hypothetical protein